MSKDIDDQANEPVRGYPSLAKFVASDRCGHCTWIFCRFGELSARNLLNLQSQLAELDAQQRQFDEEDLASEDLNTKARCRDWAKLKEASKTGPPAAKAAAKRRLDLARGIQRTMKEYQEALVREAQILSMRCPSKHDHGAFREHFNHSLLPRSDAIYEMLRGNSQHLYEDRSDLIALARSAEEDRILAFLRNWTPWLFQNGRPLRGSRVAYTSDVAMRWVAGILSIFIAAALLYGAVLHFYFVRNPHVILGLIAAYTTAFAIAVGFLTNAKRSEIFAACAAYAAVLVVFVSNPLSKQDDK